MSSLISNIPRIKNQIPLNIGQLNDIMAVGMENAVNECKVGGWMGKAMPNEREDAVLTTQEACGYLRISRPTYVKYLSTGRIRGTKAGKGWKVLKSELDQFLKGENGNWAILKGELLMKEIKPPISSFKSDSQRTIKIRTTLFDLFTVLNEEARVGEEEMVAKIVFDWIESDRLKLILH
jgi:excisionase family DNA binding protein